MGCTHPGARVRNASHFGKVLAPIRWDGRLLVARTDELVCTSCGDSVRIELEPASLRGREDLLRAMTRLTGSVQYKRCEFVTRRD